MLACLSVGGLLRYACVIVTTFPIDLCTIIALCCERSWFSVQAVPRELVEAETDHGAEEYDVYVHDAQPLAAGEEKHMLSVFVADEKGLINRVAGVFARRGSSRLPVLQKGCSMPLLKSGLSPVWL